VYDWLLLVVAGAVAVGTGFISFRDVAIAGSLLAMALPIGDFLTELQIDEFGRALHVAPLVLVAVFVWGLRRGGVFAPFRAVAHTAP